MTTLSAGILLFQRGDDPRVLLVHPGGPFWAKKDLGAWSIPKGEYALPEEAETAARREFAEETGGRLTAALIPMGEARQKSGKVVTAFAAEQPFDVAQLKSNLFEMEWPPRSGRRQSFPEIDRAQWFGLTEARARILPGQLPFIERLSAILDGE
ncbi:MAG: NUDIX domain-containing protein [Asticcacaulis sp.]